MSRAALQLFAFGQEQAAKRGLLLVDTKYEFGVDDQGEAGRRSCWAHLLVWVCHGAAVACGMSYRLVGRLCTVQQGPKWQ